MLKNVTVNAECVDDIAATNVLVNLLQPLYSSQIQLNVSDSGNGRGEESTGNVTGHDGSQPILCLAILHSLMGDTRLVKECINFSK